MRSRTKNLAEKFQRCGLGVHDARMYLKNFEDYVKKYLKAFERWWEECNSLNIAESYKYVVKYRPQPKTQEGIQELIRAIEDTGKDEYVGDYNRTGAYISHLVNKGYSRNKIKLKTGFPFNYLGVYTKKDWIIIGDVGNGVGKWMEGGTIGVIGNAGDGVGVSMGGGRIVIRGKVRDCAGGSMKDGEIIVEGGAGNGVGVGMEGGTIVIGGNAKNYAGGGMKGGTIIVKGTVEVWTGDEMRGGDMYIAYLDPRNLSNEIYGGNIYRGLPEGMGEKPELVVKDGEVLRNKF